MSPTGGCLSLCICTLLVQTVSPWPSLRSVEEINGNYIATVPPSRHERVLNFVSLPESLECLSSDGRRSGVCLNNYECKIQEGVAMGNCALGFGVCCVFSATCGGEVYNNVTYFASPHFPGLSKSSTSCKLKIRKISPHVSQVRFDLVHFNLAQPNRRNGLCETDIMTVEMRNAMEFQLCGFNSGQHMYFDVSGVKDLQVLVNMTTDDMGRMWEIKITQIEFRQQAPTGCFQYFRKPTGRIQTMNFAVNGRHLADQDYTICVRQEVGMCSIAYEPCDENSFKIGPASSQQVLFDDEGSGFSESLTPRADECTDRVVMPCDSEEFIMTRENVPGICDLLHCGNSFCTPGESTCRIESSTTPFNIRVQFGTAPINESPDDNLGMCLNYEQLPCS